MLNIIKRSPVIIKALLLNLFFLLLVIIFCDMKYEVSDDYVMQTILEGAYGTTFDPHLLFSNIILGYILVFFYQLLPSVSWYFLMHIFACFLSLTAVTWIILKKNNNLLGLLISVIWISFFSNDLYLLVQFTKTAAACCIAGGLLFLFAYWSTAESIRRKAVLSVLGALLFILGTLIRSSVAPLAVMFLFMVFLKEVVTFACAIKPKEKLTALFFKTAACFVVCLVLFVLALVLPKINRSVWDNNSKYESYYSLNDLRASITDISGADQDSYMAALLEKGYTMEDYYTIQSWNFIDRSYFTEDKINEISSIKKEISNSNNRSLSGIIHLIKEQKYYKYISVWGILALLAVIVLTQRKKMLWALLPLAAMIIQLLYYIYIGRLIYRVEFSTFLCTAAVLAAMLDTTVIKHVKSAAAAIILLLLLKIPMYIPDTSYLTMTDDEYAAYIDEVFYESWINHISKYRCCVNKRQPNKDLIHLMEEDDEHFYLCDFATTIQALYYNYKPWETTPTGYFTNTYTYLGGVTTYFPGCSDILAANGIDPVNPCSSFTNDNVRIVDNCYYYTKLGYYNEKYDPDAELNWIDKINGMNIWEIRTAKTASQNP